ncbi:hypothetical protein ABKV19_024798 [Rosa sericea]
MVLHFGMVHFSLISSESLHLQRGPKESPQLHYQSRMSRDPELRQLHHHRLPSPELMVRGKREPMKASNLAFRGSRGLLCQILMYLLLRMSATCHLTQSTYQMWSNLSLMRL